MNIRKAIVILLVIQAIVGTYFEVKNFYVFYYPYWLKHLEFPGIFEFYQYINRLLQALSYVFIFIGVIKLIRLKKIDIIGILKFPIYLFVAHNIFWLLTSLLTSVYSFFMFPEGTPFYFYIFRYISIVLLILIIINYWNSRNVSKHYIHKKEVNKSSRFFNWILDLSIILSFGFQNIKMLSNGFIFEDIAFLNNSSNWFFLINMFCYYLVMELLFLQTIGKLHNNSVVEYQGSKVKSIIIRTCSRFIPFEVFSFLGKKGWHDLISKTKVIIAKNELNSFPKK